MSKLVTTPEDRRDICRFIDALKLMGGPLRDEWAAGHRPSRSEIDTVTAVLEALVALQSARG